MQEHPVAHIKAHMADPRRVVGAHEEHQIPRPRVGYPRADVVEPLRPQPPGIAQAAAGQHIADEAGAVKGGGGAAAAPDIGKAQILLRLRDQRGKALVGQVLRRDLVPGGRVGHILGYIPGGREQVGAVAQGGHIHGVQGERLPIHHVDRQMGEVEVLQLHGADIVVVIDPVAVRMGVAVRVRPGVRLDVVPPLHLHRLGEDILLVEQHLKIPLHLVHGEGPLMERRQDGQQHIGIVLDVVQLIVVLVIVMGLLIGIQVLPQLVLFGAVGGLRRQQVRVLGEVGGGHDVGHASAQHGGAGLQQPQQHHQHKTDAADDQEHLLVPGYERSGFLRRLRGFLRTLRRRPRRCLCALRVVRRPVGRRVLPLQPLLLPDTGDGIGSGKLGVLMERLLVQHLRVGPHRRLLRLCRLPPGLQFALRPPVLVSAAPVAHGLLHAALGKVARRHARILVLHLPHLGVGGVGDLLQRPGQRIGQRLADSGGLVRLLEYQLRAPGAGSLVKDALRAQNALFRDGGPCRVQPVRRLVGTVHIFLQSGVCPFLLGELQTGGGAVRCRLALPVGSAALFPLFLLGLPDAPVVQMVEGGPRQRRGIAGGGIVLLRGTV